MSIFDSDGMMYHKIRRCHSCSWICFIFLCGLASLASTYVLLPPYPFTCHVPFRRRFSVLNAQVNQQENGSTPIYVHHTALKTRNITTAIQFYGLFDYTVHCKFRAGPARAALLQLSSGSMLEVIEVPGYMLNEVAGSRRRAIDLMERQDLLGYNHVALDVTSQMKGLGHTALDDWIDHLNQKSVDAFGKTLRVALRPQQQLIGKLVYEIAFLYDADGCLVELLHRQSELEQSLQSGWDPWDGKDFQFQAEDR